MPVQFKKTKAGHSWHTVGSNMSDIIADSAETYKNKKDAEDGLVSATIHQFRTIWDGRKKNAAYKLAVRMILETIAG